MADGKDTAQGGDWVPMVSALVANRSEFFRLLEQIEARAGISFDETALQGLIDSTFDSRGCVSGEEALWLLAAAKIEGTARTWSHGWDDSAN